MSILKYKHRQNDLYLLNQWLCFHVLTLEIIYRVVSIRVDDEVQEQERLKVKYFLVIRESDTGNSVDATVIMYV